MGELLRDPSVANAISGLASEVSGSLVFAVAAAEDATTLTPTPQFQAIIDEFYKPAIGSMVRFYAQYGLICATTGVVPYTDERDAAVVIVPRGNFVITVAVRRGIYQYTFYWDNTPQGGGIRPFPAFNDTYVRDDLMEISAFGEEAPSADGRLHSPLTTLVQSYVALREAEAREAEAASRAAALSFALESAPGPPSDLLTDAQRAQAVTVVEGYYADASVAWLPSRRSSPTPSSWNDCGPFTPRSCLSTCANSRHRRGRQRLWGGCCVSGCWLPCMATSSGRVCMPRRPRRRFYTSAQGQRVVPLPPPQQWSQGRLQDAQAPS